MVVHPTSDAAGLARPKALDTSIVRHIEQDQGVTFLMTFVCIGLVALGFWLISGDFSEYRRGSMAGFWGWATVIVCGFCTAIGVWRLLKPLNPVITLSPQGIADQRLGSSVVSWAHVTRVKEWQHKMSKYVVLLVDPTTLKNFKWSPLQRILQPLDLSFEPGLRYGALGTKIDHAELLALITAYANDHGRIGKERMEASA